jgi:hypothetical protein
MAVRAEVLGAIVAHLAWPCLQEWQDGPVRAAGRRANDDGEGGSTSLRMCWV